MLQLWSRTASSAFHHAINAAALDSAAINRMSHCDQFLLMSCNSVFCSKHCVQHFRISATFYYSHFLGQHWIYIFWKQCIRVTVPLVDISPQIVQHILHVCADPYKVLQIILMANMELVCFHEGHPTSVCLYPVSIKMVV